MRTISTLSTGTLLICAWSLKAQDPQFSQFYSAPQYLNPAFTGDTQGGRASLNYRLQWPGIQPGYETYMAGYDHRLSKLNAGIGGFVLRDKAGTTGLQTTTAAISYAYMLRIDHRRSLRAGLRMGYSMRGIDPKGFIFTDQLIRDQAPTSVEALSLQRVNYLDMAAGGLYHAEHFWAGVSFDHLNRPDQSLVQGGEAKMYVRTTVHAGYKMSVDRRPLAKSSTTATVAMLFKRMGTWGQLDLGGYVEHHALTAGLWYRGLPLLKEYAPGYGNNEALIALVGFDAGALRIGYSYGITISKLTMRTGGSHEISLVHEWPRKHKVRARGIVPCPKF